jgi:hypothetical protein
MAVWPIYGCILFIYKMDCISLLVRTFNGD